ncbi:MAG TPA: TerC family protein [Fibrobacteria bacterium]|nr:TerC family protein [Fibrobacteria bacterium]
MTTPWIWIAFNLFILAMLALDLGVFHKKSKALPLREAMGWVITWVTLAAVFNVGLYFLWDNLFPVSEYRRGEAALLFLTGYLIELSLSVDNLFVIALIFSSFGVPVAYQHRVLFWGILGALVMRGTMIAGGAALIKEFHWIIYLFGGFLIFTGFKMFFHKEKEFHPEDSFLIRQLKRFLPVTDRYEGEHFFIRRAGVLMATPLFMVLVLIEFTDLIFAVDSIPAIFGITTDPFLVYASNVFAILGLRSLYFVLAGFMGVFLYLKPALSAILIFVGTKMLLADVFKIPPMVSLAVVVSILALAAVLSIAVARMNDNPGKDRL